MTIKNIVSIAGSLALLTMPADAAGPNVLANEKIRVTLSESGKLDSVDNLVAGETYTFRMDTLTLDTDLGVFSNNTLKPARVTADKQRVVFHYEFGPGLSADLVYSLTGDNGFFRRALSIANKTPLRVRNLVLEATAFAKPAMETVHYVTFIAAPTVEFIRFDKGGLFTGIENPHFKAKLSEQGVALGFEPALILKPGEGYTSEPQFISGPINPSGRRAMPPVAARLTTVWPAMTITSGGSWCKTTPSKKTT